MTTYEAFTTEMYETHSLAELRDEVLPLDVVVGQPIAVGDLVVLRDSLWPVVAIVPFPPVDWVDREFPRAALIVDECAPTGSVF